MITIQHNQTIEDVAVQHTGDVEGCFTIALLCDWSMTYEPSAGESAEIVEVIDDKVATLFGNYYNKPATGLSEDDKNVAYSFGPNPAVVGPFNEIYNYIYDGVWQEA